MIKLFENFTDNPNVDIKNFNPYEDVYHFYYTRNDSQKKRIYKYLNFMLDVLKPGKWISFFANEDNYMSFGTPDINIRGIIKEVEVINQIVIKITVINERGEETFKMLPSSPVRIMDKEPEIVISEEDPYGEEDDI